VRLQLEPVGQQGPQQLRQVLHRDRRGIRHARRDVVLRRQQRRRPVGELRLLLQLEGRHDQHPQRRIRGREPAAWLRQHQRNLAERVAGIGVGVARSDRGHLEGWGGRGVGRLRTRGLRGRGRYGEQGSEDKGTR
jgi:hypothetical protein